MGLNITQTMNTFQFESRENLKNTAKNILNRQGASEEASKKIVEETIFNTTKSYTNPQLDILKASVQISANKSLKETLKYLKSQANKKVVKTPVLGELWKVVNKESLENYQGELVDFVVDESAKNIFIAA